MTSRHVMFFATLVLALGSWSAIARADKAAAKPKLPNEAP